ncbi:uncharacterized protein B0P05DRAFT_111052 [Gilbertella persicaria]|uniref:uncharacterized protein n=1 Tax=Gilbertella persicaria TaxID=101096 RepID=UPI00221FEAD4|nr:uncharacterized protein B0P05DRAFT_111052 [Gilbertella persicaria]KAI8078129.1 hypothetical protein B0P05DRAFT_111052 [Gilbertella persicaria]
MSVLWSKHCLLFAQCYAWFTHRSQYALCSTNMTSSYKSMLLFLFKAERMALGQYCGLSIVSCTMLCMVYPPISIRAILFCTILPELGTNFVICSIKHIYDWNFVLLFVKRIFDILKAPMDYTTLPRY